jgi:hypothetical protein
VSARVKRASIKGVAIRSAVADLRRLIDADALPSKVVFDELTDFERLLLKRGVDDEAWYPMGSYDRINRVLFEHDGNSAPDYFRNRGRAVANRVIATGMFKQVDFVRRLEPSAAVEQVVLSLRVAGTLWMGMFSIGSWRVLSAADVGAMASELGGSIGVEITDAEDFSDMAVQAIIGFMQRLAEETAGSEVEVMFERPTASVLRFDFRWIRPDAESSKTR